MYTVIEQKNGQRTIYWIIQLTAFGYAPKAYQVSNNLSRPWLNYGQDKHIKVQNKKSDYINLFLFPSHEIRQPPSPRVTGVSWVMNGLAGLGTLTLDNLMQTGQGTTVVVS